MEVLGMSYYRKQKDKQKELSKRGAAGLAKTTWGKNRIIDSKRKYIRKIGKSINDDEN